MAALKSLNDQQLVILLQEGNEPAFAELYNRYSRQIYAFASRILKSPVFAEDITHDVFVKLWESSNGLDAERNPAGYLFTIARNQVFNHIRRAGREAEILDEILWFASDSHDLADLSIDIEQGRQTLAEAINQLPPERQRIYRLCREEGMTYNQIAEVLNISYSTVNSQMVKALKSIRHYLYISGMLETLLFFYLLKK